MPYLISERGQRAGANHQGTCAGGLTQELSAHQGASRVMDKLVLGLTQRNQVPQKIQHVFPAAGPLWRSLLSVLAAILVGLARGETQKTMITVCYLRGWSRIGCRPVSVHCPVCSAEGVTGR